MKIDTSKIDGFENMTPEEKVEAFLNYEVPDVEKKYKDLISKANSEAKKYKDQAKEAEEKLLSQMSEEEKAKQEQEDRYRAIEEENNRLKKESVISKKTAFYQSLGFSKELAAETAEAFANGDFDTVEKNQITAHEEFEKNIRADVVRQNPHPQNSGGTEPERLSLAEAMKRANAGENVEIPKYKK